jgi:hypothetical protein
MVPRVNVEAFDCRGDHDLTCPCFAESLEHGEACAFLVCRATQRAALEGDLARARMIHESSDGNGPWRPERPTIVGHSGGACCPCTCPPAVRGITSLREYADAVQEATGSLLDFDEWLALYGLHGGPGGDLGPE